MTLEQRYAKVAQSVGQACIDAGRKPEDVRIIGVSKTVGLDAVAQAIEAGIHDFGENRPEELVRKHDAFPQERWHFIGNIQSRQLKSVVGRAHLIHSLFQEKHADKINSLAAEAGIVQDVLVEVNDGEENKQGIDPEKLLDMLVHCHGLDNVRVCGLMIMAPAGSTLTAQQTFEDLAILRDTMVSALSKQGITDMPLHELSMGMSNDYPQAVGQGSTMVRVGRAIFSEDYED